MYIYNLVAYTKTLFAYTLYDHNIIIPILPMKILDKYDSKISFLNYIHSNKSFKNL